eukprot:SAG31_NODE_11461_length_1027_cov_1.564655_2_plen_177_part_00
MRLTSTTTTCVTNVTSHILAANASAVWQQDRALTRQSSYALAAAQVELHRSVLSTAPISLNTSADTVVQWQSGFASAPRECCTLPRTTSLLSLLVHFCCPGIFVSLATTTTAEWHSCIKLASCQNVQRGHVASNLLLGQNAHSAATIPQPERSMHLAVESVGMFQISNSLWFRLDE